MDYYTAGYYLIKIRPIDFGSKKNETVMTCSSCINDSLLDMFSRSWAINGDEKEVAIKNFNIDFQTIDLIHSWTDKMDMDNKIGFPDIFYSINSAREYRDKFFPHLKDIKIFGLYLSKVEMDKLITEFDPKGESTGEIGLRYNLRKKEIDSDFGKLLGYDLIGIDMGGEFHTFHCHGLHEDLKRDLEIQINEFGLIENDEKRKELVEYMNDESKGFAQVPWFFAKIKLID